MVINLFIAAAKIILRSQNVKYNIAAATDWAEITFKAQPGMRQAGTMSESAEGWTFTASINNSIVKIRFAKDN